MLETSVKDRRLRHIEAAARSASLDLNRLRRAVEESARTDQFMAASVVRSEQALESIQGAVAATVALETEFLPQVVDELRLQGASLANIEALLANPSGTAAQERLRRGESLLSRRLLPEAVAELTAALSFDAYHPVTHYRLGQAQVLTEDFAGAGESFVFAARYSSDARFWAATALCAGAAFECAELRARQEEILSWAVEAVPDCPELWLAMAGLGSPGALQRALTIAPELVVDAMAAQVPRLPQAAKAVLEQGVLARSRQQAALLRELAAVYERYQIPHDLEIAGDAPTNPAEALLWCVVLDEDARGARRHATDNVHLAQSLERVPSLPTGRVPKPSLSRTLGRAALLVLIAFFAVALIGGAIQGSPSGMGLVYVFALVAGVLILWTLGQYLTRATASWRHHAATNAHSRSSGRRQAQEAEIRTSIEVVLRKLPDEPPHPCVTPLFA